MKNYFLILFLLGVTLLSCKKDAPADNIPAEQNPAKIDLKTLAAQFVYNTSAELYFEILDDGGEDLLQVGVCWSTNEQPTIKDSTYSPGKKTGSYHGSAKNLKGDTRYYARAFATNQFGTVYGNRISFITVPILAGVEFPSSTSVTRNSATLLGRIISDGGSKVTERGFVWDTTIDLTMNTKNKIVVGSDTGRFSAPITGLKAGTYYYMGAFATNKAGTVISKFGFMTLDPPPPVIVTNNGTITGTKVFAGGTITIEEGVEIIERGLIVRSLLNPTMYITTPSGSGAGTFQIELGTATRGTTYSFQAYAQYKFRISGGTTAYGTTVSFTVP